jgi:NAD(P)-dependent dehydrogenase (short-subunit alcohol dehydrogenase family)
VSGRIVLYGATGYIGGLTARAMVASGTRPVLAGRDQGRLNALAERLSRNSGGVELETAVAGSEGPGPLRELIGAGDVLVSTAGPFLKVGRSAVEAAVDAGAVYLDSTGEPPFIRQVFEEFGPRAERAGAVLLTAVTTTCRGTWPERSRSRPPDPPRPAYGSATSYAGTCGRRQAPAPTFALPIGREDRLIARAVPLWGMTAIVV